MKPSGDGALPPLPPLTTEQAAVVARMAALARERFASRAARYDAESAIELRAAQLLLHEAARVRMLGDRRATMLAVNQAKTCSAEVAVRVTERVLRMAGGRGLLKALPFERWHRDALAGPVMPPSTDRRLETIGKLLCGLEAAMLEFQ